MYTLYININIYTNTRGRNQFYFEKTCEFFFMGFIMYQNCNFICTIFIRIGTIFLL